jgi:hypothetical protein
VALGHPPLALVWRAGVPGVLEATVEGPLRGACRRRRSAQTRLLPAFRSGSLLEIVASALTAPPLADGRSFADGASGPDIWIATAAFPERAVISAARTQSICYGGGSILVREVLARLQSAC